MKKMVGLVVILAALILGGYYGMGIITERTLKKNIAIINQSHELSVEMKQYHRGWFRSNALLDWSLHLPARTMTNPAGQVTAIPAQDYNMQLPLTIYHGPMMFADAKVLFGLGYAHSDVTLPQTYADEFKLKFTPESTSPLLNLTIFVSYWNNSTIQMSLPSFKLITKKGNTQFEWLGLRSDVSVSSNVNKIYGHVTINGVRFLKEKVATILGKVSSDYDLHRSKLGLYLGDANLFVPSLLVTNDTKKAFEVRALDVHSSSNVKNDLFNSHFKATVETVFVDDKMFGPALLDLSINNLDADVLAKINEQANSIQQGSEAQRQQILLSMLPELPKLLSKGAQLSLSELRVGMPEGVVRGNLLVSLPKADAGNPFQLIQKIQGQGKLEIPTAVLKRILNDSAKQSLRSKAVIQAAIVAPMPEAVPTVDTAIAPEQVTVSVTDIDQQALMQTDAQLAAYLASGALTLHDADYVIEIKLTEGQLLVNGKPFNSAMMQF